MLACSVPGARNSFRLNLAATRRCSHALIPTLLFTDRPERPIPTISPTSTLRQPVCKSPSFDAFSTASSLLHYAVCYWYGSVAVCVPRAALCGTILRYGAAAHAFLPGQNALPWSSIRDAPHQLGCHDVALARQHPTPCYLRPLPLIRLACC